MPSQTALVTRATGSQGRGVVKHLAEAGWNVHALVTDPSADRAVALKSFGENVTLYKGIHTDPASIEAAISGCSAVFLNQMPSFADDGETKEARKILQLAKAAGVKHIVHSTVLLLNDPNADKVVEGSIVSAAVLGKRDVEELVRESGIPWTIIRPGFFMTNMISPLVAYMFPEVKDGKFLHSYGEGARLPLIDPEDIGAFVAAAFNEPQKFNGKVVPLAKEILKVEEIANAIAKASGKEVQAVYRTKEEIENGKNNPLIAGQLTSVGMFKLVDLDEVRSWGIPLTSFQEFLENHKDAIVP